MKSFQIHSSFIAPKPVSVLTVIADGSYSRVQAFDFDSPQRFAAFV
nr:hypothetical protein [Rhodopirellula sp. SM50]